MATNPYFWLGDQTQGVGIGTYTPIDTSDTSIGTYTPIDTSDVITITPSITTTGFWYDYPSSHEVEQLRAECAELKAELEKWRKYTKVLDTLAELDEKMERYAEESA